MRLTQKQSRELLANHGVYVTEACDRCGKLLGHVRLTCYGEPGEWCSRECRDGVEAAERYRTTRKHVAEHATGPTLVSNETAASMQANNGATRKGGRPQKYRTSGNGEKRTPDTRGISDNGKQSRM